MNPEIKAEWVKALRSGKYTQGAGHLAAVDDDDRQRHCCLGVLCELAAEAGKVQRAHVPNLLIAFDDYTGFLPKSVIAWAGLDSESPMVPTEAVDIPLSGAVLANAIDGWVSLAGLNDSGVPFDVIADLVDSRL